MLISRHRDGQHLANLGERWGYRSVRGSTKRGGEVGLLGELRGVAGLERRLREAARLGFVRAIVPRSGRDRPTPDIPGVRIDVADTLREAIEQALAEPAGRSDAVPAMLG